MLAGWKRHISGRGPSQSLALSIKTACSALALSAVTSCASAQLNETQPVNQSTPSIAVQPSDFDFVDCSIPGMVIQNGRRQVRQMPSRLVRITSKQCELYGGRYILSARASVQGALQVWLPQANAGDAKAQTYVAELYERGLNGIPNFELARNWYGRAVESGYAPAMLSLARLIEEGLGGPSDRAKATELYYDAMGFEGDLRGKLAQVDTAELIMLRATLEEREAMLAQQEATINRLISEINALKSEQNDTAAQLLQFEQDLAAARRSLAAALTDATESRESLQTEVAAVDLQRQQIERLERALASNEAKLAALQAEITSSTAAQTAQDAATINRLNLDLTNARQTIQQLQAERATAVAAERAALTAMSVAESDLAAQIALLAEQERQISLRETELTELIARYGDQSLTLRAEREDLSRARASLAVERNRFAEQQRSFEAQREEHKQRASALEALEDTLIAERSALSQQSEQLQRTAANLTSLQRDRDTLDQLMQKQREAQADLDTARTEYRARNEALEARESDLMRKQAKLSQQIGRVESNESRLSELTRQRDDALNRAERAEEQLADANARLDQMAELASRGLATAEELGLEEDDTSPYADIDFGDYHAILIGNENYLDEGWVDLETPHKDVDDISSILKSKYGFETTVLKDLTRMELGQAVSKKASEMDGGDNLLIYYAGHGQRINGVAYWDAIDSKPFDSLDSLGFDWLRATLAESEARKVLVVSDSCYSGVITRNVTTITNDADARLKAEHIAFEVGVRTRVALTSGGAEQEVLDEGGGGNSLFAAAFIQTLNNNAQVERASVLARSVTDMVTERAFEKDFLQEPQYGDMKNSGNKGGEFFFVPYYPSRT